MKGCISSLRKYPRVLEGQRPSSVEEEAKADDERKDLRASAPPIAASSRRNPLALRALDG